MISDNKLDFWIKNEMNVIFKGKHGVGKTSLVISAFERNGLNWLYFSAPTMDPWVDFVGVPKEIDGVLTLVRPKAFSEDTIDAIFIDEYNRAKDKVCNAVMELIQFKSINGKRFNRLKVIWAAINPDEDDEDEVNYDIRKLDPAQLDRFHVMVDIPYRPSASYFKSKYGIAGAGAIEWWNELNKTEQNDVSPRRLEYAVKYHSLNGDVRDVLPKTVNVSKLIQKLNIGPIKARLEMLKGASADEIKQEFSNINFATDAMNYIITDGDYINRYLEYLPKDMVSNLVVKGSKKRKDMVMDNAPSDFLVPIVVEIINSGTVNNKKTLKKQLVEYVSQHGATDLGLRMEFISVIDDGFRLADQNTQTRYAVLMNLISGWHSGLDEKVYNKVLHLLMIIIDKSQNGTIIPNGSTLGDSVKKLVIRTRKELVKQNVSLSDTWDSQYKKVINNASKETKKVKERFDYYKELFIKGKVIR